MDQASGKLCLDGELTIYRAGEIKETLLALLEGEPTPLLDLSGVSEIDTCGVQLLLAAVAEAARRQGRLQFSQPSAAVVEAFRLYQIDPAALAAQGDAP